MPVERRKDSAGSQEPASRAANLPDEPTEGVEPLGVCLYLSAEQLHRLGIDPGTVSKIEYQVNHDTGELELKGVTEGDGE